MSKASSGRTAALAAATVLTSRAWAGGTDRFRIGLIGCGGRGTGAAHNCVHAAEGVQLVAMGDLFADRLQGSREALLPLEGKVDLPEERCFVGFDAYRRVLDAGVNAVLLAEPPGFRPLHAYAAIEAGKHCFLEKPGSVDADGTRLLMVAAERAQAQNLGLLAGTQYRHHEAYQEVMKRVHDGLIGDVVGGQCWYNTGTLWYRERQPEWTDLEYQIRNWYYYTWLSGDHIVEQHVHNLDVMNWAMGGPPTKAYGTGGREQRTGPKWGNIYDHFTIEFEYPDGKRVMSMCRQQDGTAPRVADRVVGTQGIADPKGTIFDLDGNVIYRYDGPATLGTAYVQEHTDWINSIRAGRPLNEGRQLAESSFTGIIGRMAAYTGQEVVFNDALNLLHDLGPDHAESFGDAPAVTVAMPGRTPLEAA